MKMIRAGGRPVEGGNGQGAGGPQQFNPTGGFGGQGGPGGFDSSESSYSSSSSSSSYPYDERQGESTSSYADYNDMKRAETSSYADYNDMKRAENALDMKLLKIMKMIRAGGRPVEGG